MQALSALAPMTSRCRQDPSQNIAILAGHDSRSLSSCAAAVITGNIGQLVTGQPVDTMFVYDTDEAQAGPESQTTPSTNPGHEFTSFYEFSSPPYGAEVDVPSVPFACASSTAALVVDDNLPISGEDVNDSIPDGTYDWIEILGAPTLAGPTGNPADGQEWTLAVFSDTAWIEDGSLIPDNFPDSYTPLMLGIEFDEYENEVGRFRLRRPARPARKQTSGIVPWHYCPAVRAVTAMRMGVASVFLLSNRIVITRRPGCGLTHLRIRR